MADFQYFDPVLVEIIPASSEQSPILANLLELYAHDFSEYMELEIGSDGRFGYEQLSLYWKEAGRHPFLIQASGSLAGFALVREGSRISGAKDVQDMAEFFIVRGHRRLGIGMKAAHALWRRFPGKWEIRVLDRNRGAKKFWSKTIAAFIGKTLPPTAFQEDGVLRQLFSFRSG
jgi:predicted acetyltransferase